MVDGVGKDVLVKLADGEVVRLDHETLYLGDVVVAKATPLTGELVAAAMTEARSERPSPGSGSGRPRSA